MALAFVVHACAEPHAAVKVVEAVLRTIDERWPLAPTGRSLSMKSMAANGLGILLEALGRHEEAVRWLTQAVDLAHQAGEEDTRDRWRGNLARSLERLGRIDEARNIYQAVLAGYRARGDPVMIAFGLESLASFLIRQLDLDEALAFAEEAIQYAKKAGDERVRGTALNDLGIIAKLKQDYNVALELFQEVENLFSRLGNDEAVAAAVGNRGEILTALGEFDKAAGTFETVLNINQRLGRRDNEASTYLSLGLLSRERGDLVAAQSWFSKAVELYRALKDPSNEAFALYRLASLKANEERFEDAIEMAQTALPLVIGRNAAFTEDLWELIGRANLKLGFVIRAEEAYREALVLARELKATKAEAGISQTSQDYAHARALAEQASGLFAANSEDWAMARKVIAFCDQKLDQS